MNWRTKCDFVHMQIETIVRNFQLGIKELIASAVMEEATSNFWIIFQLECHKIHTYN